MQGKSAGAATRGLNGISGHLDHRPGTEGVAVCIDAFIFFTDE
jgi:hypothetical protein